MYAICSGFFPFLSIYAKIYSFLCRIEMFPEGQSFFRQNTSKASTETTGTVCVCVLRSSIYDWPTQDLFNLLKSPVSRIFSPAPFATCSQTDLWDTSFTWSVMSTITLSKDITDSRSSNFGERSHCAKIHRSPHANRTMRKAHFVQLYFYLWDTRCSMIHNELPRWGVMPTFGTRQYLFIGKIPGDRSHQVGVGKEGGCVDHEPQTVPGPDTLWGRSHQRDWRQWLETALDSRKTCSTSLLFILLTFLFTALDQHCQVSTDPGLTLQKLCTLDTG